MEDFAKAAKLQQFVNNLSLSQAVFEHLLGFFIRKKGEQNLETKGGRFIAIEELQEAWQDLEKYRLDNISSGGASPTPHV